MLHSGTSRLVNALFVAALLVTAGCGGGDDGPTGTGGGGGGGGGGTATVVGSVNMPDDASGVIANGNYAYVCASGSGLQVVNISDKTSPSIATSLGTITTIGGIEGFFGSGFGFVYPCANLGGFHIVDVTNPLTPSLNSTYNTPATANDITFSTGASPVACIADGASGVQFYYGSWTNTTYNTPDLATGVAANDNYCFATDLPLLLTGSGTLIVINISNPASPSLTQTLSLPGSPSGIAIKGNYLYIAAGDPGMYVINISNPASPSIAGQTGPLPASGPIAVDPARNLVYLGTTDTAGFPNDGLKVINVANPASPQVIDTVNLPNWTTGVAYYDNHVYATTTDITGPAASTLQIIDVSGF